MSANVCTTTHQQHQAQRLAVAAAARTWLGTPYHHQARIKGAGVDCALLLCEVYHAAGVVPFVDPTPYPQNWHIHRGDERYLGFVTQYAKLSDAPPQLGDLVLFKFGRAFSHAGIYVGGGLVVHSLIDHGVIETILTEPPLARRDTCVYSFWPTVMQAQQA